ncbi:glycosyltransferase [Terriglobus albidus]|uniref:Glycosyltransferase n=1 Tax=Terriglobus albidus TaxID=1592106 RepID=A0A5B9E2I6_9BACT|nr:glycosyltransferase [Terriglobus albidus]QEE26532.1 glycosyltransferase [Terriglobus albidus]
MLHDRKHHKEKDRNFFRPAAELHYSRLSRTVSVRILHLISSLDLRGGGPAEVVRLLGKTQAAMGYSVEAVSADDEATDISTFEFPVHRLGPGIGYGYSKRLSEWLKNNRSRFDAVIVHGLWQYPHQAAYTLLRGHVPYFVFVHGMLDPWFNQSFHFKHVKKLLYWHTIGRSALDGAASVIFTTDEELLRSASAFFPYKWRAMVAALGIEGPQHPVDPSGLYQRWPQLKQREYLLFFGRLHPKKGCDLLLKAFARVETDSERMLVFAGPADRSYGQYLRELAKELDIEDRILWTGMVQGAEKWAMLQEADAFVLPSHQENFAIAAVEAMCCGTPVLLSDKVQIYRNVVQEGAGLAEPDTLAGTVCLLQRWAALDNHARATMGKNARTAYRQRYTAVASTENLMHQIETELRRLRRPAPGLPFGGSQSAARHSGL